MHIVIIGVGGVGAMAAWRLAKSGHKITALEQFTLDHDRGSSYGDSRIVRRVYPDALYTSLMADAYTLWDELMAETKDTRLFCRAGGIYTGRATNPLVKQAAQALLASGVEHEVLSPAECTSRFPAFQLQEDEVAVYEPSMGYARASLCVQTATTLARQQGVEIVENCNVTAIEADNESGGVRIHTQSGETFVADRLLITAGAWTNSLLAQFGVSLPLVVSRQPYIHLEPESHAEDFQPGKFPVWIDQEANTYGFPQLGDVPGVKIGLHDHGVTSDPDSVERDLSPDDHTAALRYASQRFPWLSQKVVYEKVCLYTSTPDEDFIVDTVPGHPEILVVSACSGHGFKFTPLMGQIAASLLLNRNIPYDLTRFRLDRFRA